MTKKKKQSHYDVMDKQKKTNSGFFVSGGEIAIDENEEVGFKQLQKDYRKMMKEFPIIPNSFFLLVSPIMSAKPRIDIGKSKSEKAKEAQLYIQDCIDIQHKGFHYKMKHDVRAILNGCALSEKIIKRGDEYTIIKTDGKIKKVLTNRVIFYSPIQNTTIEKFYIDENNNFVGIQHEKRIAEKGSTAIEIREGKDGIKNIDDVLSVCTFDELYLDPTGNSMLRASRLLSDVFRKVFLGRAVNLQAGHGIVEIITDGEPDATAKARLKKTAKNINALNGEGYFMHDKNTQFILNELKGQMGAQQFIEFTWKLLLMTFLTQFISIGMGQVGAYNAGESLKSPYELAINTIAEWLKRHYQSDIEYWIDISYLSGLAKEDMPIFEWDGLQGQSDLLKTSQIILNLKNAGVNFSNEELDRIKALIAILPEKSEITNDKTIEDNAEGEQSKENIEMSRAKPKTRNVKSEILEFEAMYFDSNGAESHYLETQDKAKGVIDNILSRIMNDVKQQIKTGNKITIGYKGELEKKLLRLFTESYNRGETDIKKEVAEISKTKKLKLKSTGLELALSDKMKNKQNKLISINIDNLINKISTTVNHDVVSMSEKQINSMGGYDAYIEKLSEQFKGPIRDLINDVTCGYTVGRNNKIDDITEDDTVLICSEILDKNLCDNCAADDGNEYTKTEIKESSYLSLDGDSIHVNCLGLQGGNKCRGQWVVYA